MAEASKGVSKELVSLIKLVSFFKQIRHKDDLQDASFFFVNDLFNILPYRQCVFWTYANNKVNVRAASGQIDVGNQSPFAQFLKKAVKDLLKTKLIDQSELQTHIDERGYADTHVIEAADLPAMSQDVLKEWLSPNTICVFLYNQKGLIGGVWLERDKKLGEMERAVLDDACDAFSAQLQLFRRSASEVRGAFFADKKVKVILTLLFLVFCFWPVRFSVTANAEIVPQQMQVVTVPFGSLISEVFVKPNQLVKKDDLLFSLDKTQLENEYALSVQKLETIRQKLAKTEREAFADPAKRSELNGLKEEIKSKRLEVDYRKQRLAVSDIRAAKDGVLLFSDVNDIVGQPVRAGDKIMVLADPDDIELLIRIPSDSIIDIDEDVHAKFFLNIEPLKSYEVKIQTISYQPTRDSDGILSYKARANIIEEAPAHKIGLNGTAKVFGDRTVMILNILRRPFIALRNFASF